MRRYRVRTYRARGKSVKLSPIQTIDFLAIWLAFMLAVFFYLSSAIDMNSFNVPLFLLGIMIIILFYLPLRWKMMNEEKKNMERILSSGIRDIDLMEGVQFERYLELLFRSMGYNVQTTSATGDFGADLILKKDNQTIAVQAKRYNKVVGVKAVQEVYSSMPYYGASEGWVVTNNTFSKSAYELAERSNIFLIDRGMLIEMILNNKKASGT